MNIAETLAKIRARVVSTCYHSQGGHIASSLSSVEIFYSLLVSRYGGAQVKERDDRLIVSSCQCALALYSVLCELGYITEYEIRNFLSHAKGSLAMFPNTTAPWSDFNAGSLGHGISFGVGQALIKKRCHQPGKVFVVVGDGELDEGENWEGLMAANHYTLSNLVVIVNYNGVQISGSLHEVMDLGDIGGKLKAFGANVHFVDGHSVDEMKLAFRSEMAGNRPTAIICRTVKGKGLEMTEKDPSWHYRIPTPLECQYMLNALNANT